MLSKISQKLLAINVGIILSLTSVFIGFSYFSSDSLFSNALNGIDTTVMEDLAPVLSEHYRTHGSWEGYMNNKAYWEETVNKRFFSTFFELMAKTKAGQSRHPFSPSSEDDQKPAPEQDFSPSFGTFLQRVSLLDINKQELIKAEMFRDKVNYQAIKLDGRTIGWLRVGDINVDMLPLADYFFKQQLSISTWAAFIGGLIAIILSFFFSYNLTAPIKRLTLGAREIAKRNFTNTIHVDTKDELKELAESFNTISKELLRYETLQKQWIMDISHELRTPLTILIGEMAAICDNLSTCDIAAVAALHQEAVHIKRLVDDLDELVTIENLDFSMNKEEFDIQLLMQMHVQRYREKFSAQKIHIHNEYLSIPAMIFGDPDRISQVFKNIFENSLRYTNKPGELWVKLTYHNKYLTVTIEDSGPGVAEESIEKIFDRLYRTDSSRSRITGGVGLGLTICKKIITAHKGEITAKKSKKGGLSIHITLPFSAEYKHP